MSTVDLDPDEPSSADLCKDCEASLAACPVDALSEPGRTHLGLCVRQIHPHGLSGLIKFLTEGLDRPKDEVKQYFLDPNFWNLYQSPQVEISLVAMLD